MNKSFTVAELREALASLSLIRRKAILFALESQMSLSRVVTLRWAEAISMKLPTLSKDILNSVPRHLRFDYVFWEFLPDARPAPIFQLDHWLRKSSGMTFEELKVNFDGMIWVDQAVEVQQFMRAIKRLSDKSPTVG